MADHTSIRRRGKSPVKGSKGKRNVSEASHVVSGTFWTANCECYFGISYHSCPYFVAGQRQFSEKYSCFLGHAYEISDRRVFRHFFFDCKRLHEQMVWYQCRNLRLQLLEESSQNVWTLADILTPRPVVACVTCLRAKFLVDIDHVLRDSEEVPEYAVPLYTVLSSTRITSTCRKKVMI